MALPVLVKKLEDVAANLREHYVQKDGYYLLDATPVDGWAVDQVDSIKRKVSELTDKHRKATDKLKAFETEDGELLDPSAAREALGKLKELSEKGGSEKKVQEQIEAVKAQLADKHGKEAQKLNDRLAVLERSLHKHVVTNAALAALAKTGANADLLLPHVERFMKVDEVDGEFVARVLNDDGKTVRLTKAQGRDNPMDVEEFVSTFRERFPAAFPATTKQGTGENRNGSTGAAGGVVKLSRDDAQDTTKYRAAKAVAEKAGAALEITD